MFDNGFHVLGHEIPGKAKDIIAKAYANVNERLDVVVADFVFPPKVKTLFRLQPLLHNTEKGCPVHQLLTGMKTCISS